MRDVIRPGLHATACWIHSAPAFCTSAWMAGQLVTERAASTSASIRIATACPNTVHFPIRMAAAKSIRVVGWGVRGRSG